MEKACRDLDLEDSVVQRGELRVKSEGTAGRRHADGWRSDPVKGRRSVGRSLNALLEDTVGSEMESV